MPHYQNPSPSPHKHSPYASHKGECLCGSCQFVLTAAPNWMGHCHCDSCRRGSGAAFVTWIGQENGCWIMEVTIPHTYESSPGITWGFCGTCGSRLFYRAEKYPNEVHFPAALLEDPNQIKPLDAYHIDEKLGWTCLAHMA